MDTDDRRTGTALALACQSSSVPCDEATATGWQCSSRHWMAPDRHAPHHAIADGRESSMAPVSLASIRRCFELFVECGQMPRCHRQCPGGPRWNTRPLSHRRQQDGKLRGPYRFSSARRLRRFQHLVHVSPLLRGRRLGPFRHRNVFASVLVRVSIPGHLFAASTNGLAASSSARRFKTS